VSARILADRPTTVTPPTVSLLRCPICTDLRAEIKCWLALERQLRADLATCNRADDAEVLAADLRRAGLQIDGLIELGRRMA
jgi:hypothetical protein